jgi:hypothetical protein
MIATGKGLEDRATPLSRDWGAQPYIFPVGKILSPSMIKIGHNYKNKKYVLWQIRGQKRVGRIAFTI